MMMFICRDVFSICRDVVQALQSVKPFTPMQTMRHRFPVLTCHTVFHASQVLEPFMQIQTMMHSFLVLTCLANETGTTDAEDDRPSSPAHLPQKIPDKSSLGTIVQMQTWNHSPCSLATKFSGPRNHSCRCRRCRSDSLCSPATNFSRQHQVLEQFVQMQIRSMTD